MAEVIPAEAVEAAWRDKGANPKRAISRSEVWAILEAAAPYMQADSWDEGFEGAQGVYPQSNPYRSQT